MPESASPLSAEDNKLLVLARATRARTRAAEGAAVRDLDGRTYAAATVDLPSLSLSALEGCVAMAIAAGATGLEQAVLLTDALETTGAAAVSDFAGEAVAASIIRVSATR